MKISKKYLCIAVLVIIAIVSHIEWFNPWSILASGDWQFRYAELLRGFFGGWNAWINFEGLGSPNIQLVAFPVRGLIWNVLSSIGFSYDLIVKITLLIVISIGGFVFPFILSKKLIKNDLISLISSATYATSIYFLIIETRHLFIAVVFVLLPLVIYFFDKALHNNKIINWVIFCLIYTTGIVYEIRVMSIVSFIIILYFFTSTKFKNYHKYLIFILFSSIIILLLNIYWITSVKYLGGEISQIANRGLFGNNLFSITQSFTNFRWSWTGGLEDRAFVVQPIQWYLWIIPIISLISLFYKKRFHEQKIFFLILFVIGIFLTKQSSRPFPEIYLWLYNNIPGFNLFREASKFYLITSFSYLGLVGLSLHYLKGFNKKIFYIIASSLVLVALINLKPLVTGEIGGIFINEKSVVPADYSIFKEYVKKQGVFFRTIWAPNVIRTWGYYTDNNPRLSLIDFGQNQWSIIENTDTSLGLKSPEDKVLNILKQPLANNAFDLLSIKYLILPIQEKTNFNDIFVAYGGKDNINIREYYEAQLDTIPFLKKINIGTKELIVYENKNYKEPIFSFPNLYRFNTLKNLETKYYFINKKYGGDVYFSTDNKTESKQSTILISNLFESSSSKNINSKNKSLITTTTNNQATNNNLIYTNKNKGDIFLNYNKKNIQISIADNEWLSLNNLPVSSSSTPVSTPINFNQNIKKYYIGFNSKLTPLTLGETIKLNEKTPISSIVLYSLKNNTIKNSSFENGFWLDTVSDCNFRDNNGLLAMNLNEQEKTEGRKSLQLEATRHIACTSQKFMIEPDEYVLSFDYQSPNSKRAGYYLQFNDASSTAVNDSLTITDNNWHNFLKKVTVPIGATTANLHIYAYASDNQTNNIVRYDNFIFSKLNLEKEIAMPAPKDEFAKIPVDLKDDENTFEYKDDNYNYQNILDNGSFENGLWSERVGDCNARDNNAVLSMNLDNQKKTDGNNSLELGAIRHIACTSTQAPVRAGATYLLSFDYQSDNAERAGYYIGFNDKDKTNISERLPIKNKTWNSFEKKITIPDGVNTLGVYVYAYESDGKKNNIVRYDNFKLIEIPDLDNKYYLVSEPKEKLVEPASTTFELINPTKKLVHIKGATTAFFLAMSESYHPQWQAQMNNEKIHGALKKWWPFAKPDRVGDEYHYKLNGFLNAWFVDPAVLCKPTSPRPSPSQGEGVNTACVKNPDGSYDVEMVIEFWPQRWFYLGLIISGTTLAGCLGYLGYAGVHGLRRRRKNRTTIKNLAEKSKVPAK